MVRAIFQKAQTTFHPDRKNARCRFRTCDPYRVKVMLYH